MSETPHVTEAQLDLAELLRRFAAIEARLERGDKRMGAIETDLRANTAATQAQTETLTEVRKLLETGRAAFRLADWFGKGVRWLGGIAAAVAAIWAAIYALTHGGKPPP